MKAFDFVKRFTLMAVITAFLFTPLIAADRVDAYHINLKGDMIIKNIALKQYPILLNNKDGTLRFRVDSAGNVYIAGTLTSVGAQTSTGSHLPSTIGTLTEGSSTYYWKGGYFAEIFWKSTKLVDSSGNITSGGKIIATDSARVQGNLTVNGTALFSNYIFGVDSFTTTAPADTVTVTGVTASSYAFVQLYNPPYSATADTATVTSICLVSGVGTAQLAVTRAKASGDATPAGLKSGQHYRYFIRK
jgi:hypothetical protein